MTEETINEDMTEEAINDDTTKEAIHDDTTEEAINDDMTGEAINDDIIVKEKNYQAAELNRDEDSGELRKTKGGNSSVSLIGLVKHKQDSPVVTRHWKQGSLAAMKGTQDVYRVCKRRRKMPRARQHHLSIL